MFVALQQQSAGNGDAAQYHGIRASRVAVLMIRISLDYSSGCEHDVVGGRHSRSVAAAKGEGEGGVTDHEECGWLSHGRGGGGGSGTAAAPADAICDDFAGDGDTAACQQQQTHQACHLVSHLSPVIRQPELLQLALEAVIIAPS